MGNLVLKWGWRWQTQHRNVIDAIELEPVAGEVTLWFGKDGVLQREIG
jgi:hypothetical protein